MYKVKFKKVILTFILFIASLLFIIGINTKYTFAHDNIEVSDWNVKITSNTKDITSKDTEDIIFKVKDNSNVAKGKIAPGTTAVAELELSLVGTKYSVDFSMQADTSLLSKNFKLTAKIDDEEYELGQAKLIELGNKNVFDEENGNKKITLILTWENNEEDSIIQKNITNIRIPITWTIEQHI